MDVILHIRNLSLSSHRRASYPDITFQARSGFICRTQIADNIVAFMTSFETSYGELGVVNWKTQQRVRPEA